MHIIILERDNCSPQAAAGRNLVAGLQFSQHGLPFLLLALLRHDQDKVENSENEDERSDPQPSRGAALQC